VEGGARGREDEWEKFHWLSPLCATRCEGSEQRCSPREDPDSGPGRDGVPGRLEVRIIPRLVVVSHGP
jgi:hypothetical protein